MKPTSSEVVADGADQMNGIVDVFILTVVARATRYP